MRESSFDLQLSFDLTRPISKCLRPIASLLKKRKQQLPIYCWNDSDRYSFLLITVYTEDFSNQTKQPYVYLVLMYLAPSTTTPQCRVDVSQS